MASNVTLYALNHLSGYNVTIEDIKNFRQPGNRGILNGHPEGVETSQGISNAGDGNRKKHLAAEFNRFPDYRSLYLCIMWGWITRRGCSRSQLV